MRISGSDKGALVGFFLIPALCAAHKLGFDPSNYCTADHAGYVAEQLIEDRLEFPKSAKFVYGSDDHVYLNGGCKFTVTGHVDGESLSGIKRRAGWIARFIINSDDGEVKSVDSVNIY